MTGRLIRQKLSEFKRSRLGGIRRRFAASALALVVGLTSLAPGAVAVSAASKDALSEKSFGDTTQASIPAFFALSRAKASLLFDITFFMKTPAVFSSPSAIESMIA